ANGNTLTGDGISYTYDFENRLTTSSQGNTTIVYDGDGNRVAQTTDGVTTRYLVDDRNPSTYAQVVEELVDGQVQRTYTYGLDLISQSQINGGTPETSFYMYDVLGSVRSLADATGAITDRYTYDAFGAPLATSGTTSNAYRFAGEQWDSTTGLTYLRARYYEPNQGRFLTLDPYAGRVAEPLTLHKYMYAHADPVNNIDPSGQSVAIAYVQTTQISLAAMAQVAVVGLAIACTLNLVASALVVAMTIAIEGGTIELNQALCMAKHKPGKWSCTASCNVQNNANIPNCPDRVTGSASGSNEGEACRAAKRVATQSAPRGTYARHCQCKCTKN
ncbi:MAG: hypothetical protein JOZ51_26690, partial [Chloroflexi bacterium]|nr:hypothetical protein [Chloroflexota bacterium]